MQKYQGINVLRSRYTYSYTYRKLLLHVGTDKRREIFGLQREKLALLVTKKRHSRRYIMENVSLMKRLKCGECNSF